VLSDLSQESHNKTLGGATTGRWVMITLGLTGDLLPFTSVAAIARRQGHEVVFVSSPMGAVSLRRLGFEARSVGPSYESYLRKYPRAVFNSRASGALSWVIALRHLFEPWSRCAGPKLAGYLKDSDLVITHPLVRASYRSAIDAGVQLTTLQLYPSLSRAGFSGFFEGQNDSAIAHDLLSMLQDAPMGEETSLWDYWDLFPSLTLAEPALGSAFNLSAPFVGFPLGTATHVLLDEECSEFVRRGAGSLVLVCNGTHTATLRRRAVSELAHACRTIGLSTLVLGDTPAGFVGERHILARPFIPLAAVEPRPLAAVHHCGAGTMRAISGLGIPSIAVPGPFDTTWNARAFRDLCLLEVSEEPLRGPSAATRLATRLEVIGAADRGAVFARAQDLLVPDAAREILSALEAIV